MKKIAIIGSGFFGVSSALILSKKHKIDLYEKNNTILCGASRANQMRFHMGYHYPRSNKTFNEISKYNAHFINFFGKSIFGKTINFYGVSKIDSKTSFYKYKVFLNKNNLYYKLSGLNHFSKRIEGSIQSKEKILNYFKIKEIIFRKLKKNKNIKVLLNKQFNRNLIKDYDKIIICTYDQNNKILRNLGLKPKKKFKFELVEKIIVSLPKKFRKKSFMVLDGQFVCLDPYLGTNFHLLSDNINSKLEITKSYYPEFKNYRKKYLNKPSIKILKKSKFKNFIKNGEKYLPFLSDAKYVSSFFVTRVIDIGKEKTDERTSRIEKITSKIFTIFSGKWNTSVGIAKSLNKILNV